MLCDCYLVDARTVNTTLQNLTTELTQLIDAVTSAIPNDEPFSIAHGNWTFPSVSKLDLIKAAQDVIDVIAVRGPEDLGPEEPALSSFVRKLSYLRTSTVPNIWGNAAAGVPSYLSTIEALSRTLQNSLQNDGEVAIALSLSKKRLVNKLRALEVRLDDAEPRSDRLSEMLARIEQAYEAADQLPADLQSLAEDRRSISELVEKSRTDHARIQSANEQSHELLLKMVEKEAEASSVLEHVHSAYAAATSQGLAAAFTERSNGLATTMWVWTAAFTVALIVGAYFGAQRVHEIAELVKNPAMTNWALAINTLLAALSVGAPIWFGWMATKQINQRFRLSEDYAFKAAVSRAYEGYRKEAARIDKDMEARLLASALARLDEQPLRFVDINNHGSPWQELASSEAVKSAMNSVPGFADKVIDIARAAISSRAKSKGGEAVSVKAVLPDVA